MRVSQISGIELAALAFLLASNSVRCLRFNSLKWTSINTKSSISMPPLYYSAPETVAKTDVVSIGSQAKPMKVGVLLLNLGGPETMEDVEGFLYNLFADPDIIRLPTFLSLLQKPIAYAIAKKRAPKSSAAYLSIGGGSPIVKYTKAQADLIQASLIEKGLDAKCYFAMRYWNPYTEEVLDQMQKDEINTMVVIPLYPQYSISTSGSSLKLLEDIFYNQPDKWGPDKVQCCPHEAETVSLVTSSAGATVPSTMNSTNEIDSSVSLHS
jgi:protoheme ferro-lyase